MGLSISEAYIRSKLGEMERSLTDLMGEVLCLQEDIKSLKVGKQEPEEVDLKVTVPHPSKDMRYNPLMPAWQVQMSTAQHGDKIGWNNEFRLLEHDGTDDFVVTGYCLTTPREWEVINTESCWMWGVGLNRTTSKVAITEAAWIEYNQYQCRKAAKWLTPFLTGVAAAQICRGLLRASKGHSPAFGTKPNDGKDWTPVEVAIAFGETDFLMEKLEAACQGNTSMTELAHMASLNIPLHARNTRCQTKTKWMVPPKYILGQG